MSNKTYIIILNYNGWQDTIECLESVLKSDYDDYQIIVVDNNSPNCSMDYLIKWAKGELCLWLDNKNQLKYLSFPLEKKPLEYIYYTKEEAIKGGDKGKESISKNPIIFIQAGENRGFAAGNNIGIKYALSKNDFEYIWLLNNDTVIEKDSLKELILGIQRYKKIGAVGSKIFYYDNINLLQNIGSIKDNNSFFKLCKPILDLSRKNIDNGDLNYDIQVDDIMGASLLIKKEIIKKIGLMPEEYFLYGEETDWNFNLKKNGYKLMTICKSKIYHKKSQTTGGALSDIVLYYRTRNQYYLYKRYNKKYKYFLFAIVYTIKKILFILKLPLRKKIVVALGIKDGICGIYGKKKF